MCLSKAALFPCTGTAHHQRGALHARLFDYPGTWTVQCQSSAGRNAGVSGTAFAEQKIGIPSKKGTVNNLSYFLRLACLCLLYLVANSGLELRSGVDKDPSHAPYLEFLSQAMHHSMLICKNSCLLVLPQLPDRPTPVIHRYS